MAIHTGLVDVDTTAAAITGSPPSVGDPESISVQWVSGSDVYLGGPDVSASADETLGRAVSETKPLFECVTTEPLYAVVASSTAVVHVFRTTSGRH